MHFAEAYEEARRLVMGALAGPLWLMGAGCFDLLVAFVCTRSSDVSWPLIHWCGGRGLFYRIGEALTRLKRQGRRLQGVRRGKFASDGLRELLWSFPALLMPRDADAGILARVRHAAIHRLAGGCPHRRRWLQLRTRLVRGRAATYASMRLTMIGSARRADVAALKRAAPALVARARSGADLVRIKKHWKVPMIRGPVAQWSEAVAGLEGWTRVAKRCETQRWDPETLAGPLLTRLRPPADPLYSAHVRALPRAKAGQTLIVEDKDTAAAWLADEVCYQWRSWKYITQDGTWQETSLGLQEAAQEVAAQFLPVQGKGLLGAVSMDKWAEGLPRLYTTQKAKCWATGAHTCTRQGHCCVRRISSWYRFPAKAVLRRVGKAWRGALLFLGHGDATRCDRVCALQGAQIAMYSSRPGRELNV